MFKVKIENFKSFLTNTKKENRKSRGMKIRIGGRIGGVSKAKFRKFNKGSIGTSTMAQPLFYTSKPLHTKWGIMGFKIWKSI